MSDRIRFAAIFALLLLASCGQPKAENYYTGTEGITVAFEDQTPPAEAYEGSSFTLVARLWNKGAFPVNYSHIALEISGDPFYVEIKQDPLLATFLSLPKGEERFRLGTEIGAVGDDEILEGKNYGFPSGETLDLRPTVTVKEIMGLRESPHTQLFASLCYPYITNFTSPVCVDTNAFNGNTQRQVCEAQALTFSSQGAPVAVTLLENRPTPKRVQTPGGRGYVDIVSPLFIIRIKNVGSGAVLMPPSTKDRNAEACGMRIPSSLLNGVAINASLSGKPLACDPSVIILRNGEGYASCTIPPGSNLSLSDANFISFFSAELRYLYRQGVSSEFSIIRREGPTPNYTYVEQDQMPGFVEGYTRCEFCSMNRNDPRCAGWPEEANDTALFRCACGPSECRKKFENGGLCVYGQAWCPGTNYCCA